ncbi:hypothetical protein KZX50_16865 [Bacillus infantis]|uniref:hypothetical protein n=1 Tax=Bacillus infantis TaxID=324767 RepID=UPI002002F854|nr:hypothetical protein [Bacillus infantis]MCK6207116.1 hypothetical protein [Bacillus infantis]
MAYDIEPEIKDVLVKIDFVKRYKSLAMKFSNKENKLSKFENGKVLDVFESLGYKARYMKKEDFFIVGEVKNKEIYTVKFNVSLKYGVVELIWSARHNGVVKAGDPWDMFVRLMTNDTETIPVMFFQSYEELQEIMKIAFGMYEDFKCELIKVYSPE